MEAQEIRTAKLDGMKCSKCRIQIKAGDEFVIERWPNHGGFDHYHYECPPLADNTGPRVVQGRNRRSTP